MGTTLNDSSWQYYEQHVYCRLYLMMICRSGEITYQTHQVIQPQDCYCQIIYLHTSVDG